MPTDQRTTALITGASVGIGYELAKEFAAHGHDLILVARARDRLEALAGQVEGKHGITATVLVFDLADPSAPQGIFDSVNEQGLTVDILVNNAGFGLGGAFADTDLDRELAMIQVNVASLVQLTKLFMQPMLKRKKGRILNVGSTAGFQPGPLMSIYYATKAFILSFSQAIDEELRNTGVTVTCLCPGSTDTEFAERAGISNTNLFRITGVDDPAWVARYGYAATMRGQRLAIPGLKHKTMVQLERFVPRALVTTLARKVQERR
jgi:short-subunit dehydrogenase